MFMNSVQIVGRVAQDPVYTKAEDATKNRAWFVVAANRPVGKDENGKPATKADFIPVVCWGARADAVAAHVKKGKEIGVRGRLHSWQKTGEDGKVTANGLEVVADEDISFGSDAKTSNATPAQAPDGDTVLKLLASLAGQPEALAALASLGKKAAATEPESPFEE
jgi:single-strand DNA-binding protein